MAARRVDERTRGHGPAAATLDIDADLVDDALGAPSDALQHAESATREGKRWAQALPGE